MRRASRNFLDRILDIMPLKIRNIEDSLADLWDWFPGGRGKGWSPLPLLTGGGKEASAPIGITNG